MIGQVNGAFDAFGGHTNEFGDWELGATALGVCDAAVEMAVKHCKSRIQGGKRIIEHQAIQLKLSDMHTLTEALRSFVLSTAAEVDEQGEGAEFLAQQIDPKRKSTLMIFATDAVQRVTQLNMDVHGGAGVMRDVGAEKLVRDSMVWTHLAGDAVRRLSLAKYF